MMDRIAGIVIMVVLLVVNVALVMRHQKTVFEMKRRHIMALQRLSEASRINLPAPLHAILDAVVDEETDKV